MVFETKTLPRSCLKPLCCLAEAVADDCAGWGAVGAAAVGKRFNSLAQGGDPRPAASRRPTIAAEREVAAGVPRDTAKGDRGYRPEGQSTV